jgi:hypothetical protein
MAILVHFYISLGRHRPAFQHLQFPHSIDTNKQKILFPIVNVIASIGKSLEGKTGRSRSLASLTYQYF